MSKNHSHSHCSHSNISFCHHCNVAYCKDCGNEWGRYNYTYQYPWSGTLLANGTHYTAPASSTSGSLPKEFVETLTKCDHGD